MTKQPYNVVNPPTGQENQRDEAGGPPEPLSGGKKVKNKNHSRNNHGEGS
ncbi:small acid-soluble spore protein P [Gorillibacterium sp. sgz5001074]